MKDIIDFVLKDDEANDRREALRLKREELEHIKNIENHVKPNDYHIVRELNLDNGPYDREDIVGVYSAEIDHFNTMTIPPQLIDYSYEIEKGKSITVNAGDSIEVVTQIIYSIYITTTTTSSSIMQIFLAGKKG